MARAFLFLTGIAAVFFLSSPVYARTCTEIGCVEGLTAWLQANACWTAGSYRFIIQADEKTMQCEGTLPFSSCDGVSVHCDSDEVTIGESGCALPPNAHSFDTVQLRHIPQKFSLIIEHAGRRSQYNSVVTPSCGYPNGKECDKQACCSAILEVPLNWR
jgi:hypothetical protein